MAQEVTLLSIQLQDITVRVAVEVQAGMLELVDEALPAVAYQQLQVQAAVAVEVAPGVSAVRLYQGRMEGE